jgi:hypothetical protein
MPSFALFGQSCGIQSHWFTSCTMREAWHLSSGLAVGISPQQAASSAQSQQALCLVL